MKFNVNNKYCRVIIEFEVVYISTQKDRLNVESIKHYNKCVLVYIYKCVDKNFTDDY